MAGWENVTMTARSVDPDSELRVVVPSVRDLIRLWIVDDAPDIPASRRIIYWVACTVTSAFYAVWVLFGIGSLTVTAYVDQHLWVGGLRFWAGAGLVGLLGCYLDVRWVRWCYPLGSLIFWVIWMAFAAAGDHGAAIDNRAGTVALGVMGTLAAFIAVAAHWVLRLSVRAFTVEKAV